MWTSTPIQLVIIGIGATALLDVWIAILRRAGVQTTDLSLIGRWVGHLLRGKPLHVSIRKAAPVRGESALGYLTHYATGILFAGVLFAFVGSTWLQHPSLPPALAVGLATVIAPLFVMQPAMGAGFAGSKTQRPLLNCLRSVVNHAIFGAGMYLSAVAIQFFSR